MKKKIIRITLLLLSLFIIASCSEKEESEDKMTKTNQDLTIIEQDDNGEITKGTLEGYTFTETEEITNRVKIQMENGDVILLVLSNSDTPITIANFQKLVSEKFYDGLTFHRVISGFMIQGGDPNGDGTGGSSETIKGEFSSNGVENNLSHTRGVISMARSSANDSASSQFFIMHADSTYLDGNYAAFGKVFAGLDAVDTIASTEVTGSENSTPVTKQVIKSMRFITIEK